MSAQETQEFLGRVIGRYESDGFGLEALEDRHTGALIGWAGLAVPHFLPEILPAVEVGWRLCRSVSGPRVWQQRRVRRRWSGVSPKAGLIAS